MLAVKAGKGKSLSFLIKHTPGSEGVVCLWQNSTYLVSYNGDDLILLKPSTDQK